MPPPAPGPCPPRKIRGAPAPSKEELTQRERVIVRGGSVRLQRGHAPAEDGVIAVVQRDAVLLDVREQVVRAQHLPAIGDR